MMPELWRTHRYRDQRAVILRAVLVLALAGTTAAQEAKQALFERVFGAAVKLDPDTVAKVKAVKPGERVWIDRNGDGANEEVWYIDTAVRHTDQVRPLLVRAIDEDGDLDEHMGPDLDSDLYVVDFQADGTVDVVLDYQDNDADNDVDEMAFYLWSPEHRSFGKNTLLVWWARDDGDDNLLWYDVNYTYDQPECQYRCHFSGDETFVAFGLQADSARWVAAWENPFLFYDPDGDRCSEVVLRVEGLNDRAQAIRYSFDADDDAFGRRTHDYDFSITAIAEQDNPVKLPDDSVAGQTLRGIPTQRWLQREHARAFVAQAPWARALLTWDELNANTEVDVEHDPHERWEGIIAHASEDFPQIGGPPCSPFNKRNEVSLEPIAPLRLYYDPTDRRLHLKGANKGWLDVDYDLDGKTDAKYAYWDDNNDGIFDRRTADLDADGKLDFEWKMQGADVRVFDLEFEPLATFYRSVLDKTLADSQYFIDAANAALATDSAASLPRTQPPRDPVSTFFLQKLSSWMPATGLGERIRSTPAGARLYVDLVRDRTLHLLQQRFGEHKAWKAIASQYACGNYRVAAEIVARELTPSGQVPAPSTFRAFTQRIPLRIDNPASEPREHWPITVPLKQLRAAVSDFNPDNYTITAPQRWIDWREIPSQIDEVNPAVGQELTFLADLPAHASTTYYLYFSPIGQSDRHFNSRTATAEDWVPPNIGWESNRVAYRAYWGQFDFFGKQDDRLIYPDIGAASYHEETAWGIDALHVGKTSGLGGLTLYLENQAYRIQNPAGEGTVRFTKRRLTAGPVRAAIEITAHNIVSSRPELQVRLCGLIYAERQETEVQASVTGSDGEVVLAPGLVTLPREDVFADAAAGCFGTWGQQGDVIGDIGLGLIVSPDAVVDVVDLAAERRVRCRTSHNKLRYWLIGDWRRGRQHPIAPTIGNWHEELQQLAAALLREPTIQIGRPEQLGGS